MKVLDYIFAARPMLHLPVWTVYLVALHYHHQLSGESFDLIDLVIMICLNLLFAGAFYINQVFDFESDRDNNKLGFLQKGMISEREMMAAFLLCSVVAIGVGPFISKITLFLFILIFLLAHIYSAPPLRLKDRPVGGLISNMLAHGFIIAIIVMPGMNAHNNGLLGWDTPFYLSLTVGGTYILTTIPDIVGDREAGKRTIGVALGVNISLVISFILFGLAAAIAFIDGQAPLFYLAGLAIFLVMAAMMIRTEGAVLIAAKLPILGLTLLAGYWYPFYFLFVVALLVATRIYYLKRFGIIYPRFS